LDGVAGASIRRLSATWFPKWRCEWHLRADGSLASDEEAAQCRYAYNKERDENLGGVRSSSLLEMLGLEATEWSNRCHAWAKTALALTTESAEYKAARKQAISNAQRWFAQRLARLNVRERHVTSEGGDRERSALQLEARASLALLEAPRIEIDALGVYVLSARTP
jgi:hypothetical protein